MMSISEMRRALSEDTLCVRSGCKMPAIPASCPDAAVRHIYEYRNGLPLSTIGRPAETRSFAEINSRYVKSVVTSAAVISSDEREQMQRRLALASL